MQASHLFRSVALGAFLGLGGALHAGDPAPADAGWSDDVAGAFKTAGAQDKDVLMDFTGSDWCGWCQKLKGEVFDQEAFKKDAPAHFVLVELDFPQGKKLPPAIIAQNAQWMKKFNVQGFPTIMLVDAKGRPFAQLGYASGGPGPYLKTLEEMRARRVARDEKWAQAAKAEGIEKIKLLHGALQALQDDQVMFQYYGPEIEALLKLDADGSAGVKAVYSAKLKTAQAKKLFEDKVPGLLDEAEKNADGALKKLQDLAADKRMTPEFRQKTLFLASQVCRMDLKDMGRAEKLFDEAVAADPDSEIGIKLQTNKNRLYPKGEPMAGPKPAAVPSGPAT